MILQPQFVMPGQSSEGLITQNLVGFWECNEGAIATLSDSAGSSTLTKVGSATTYSASGTIGLNMGNNGYYYCNSNSALSITGAITVIVRVYIYSAARIGNQGIVSKYEGEPVPNLRSYALILADQNLPGSVGFVVSSDGTFANAKQVTSTAIQHDAWHTLTGRFSPSSEMCLFDGDTKIGSLTADVPASIYASSAKFAIGSQFRLTYPDYHLKGVVDWVRVYNTDLTDSQIAQIASGNG